MDPSPQSAQNTRRPIRELVDDRLLDELLARSRDQAGGLRLTGEGSMLGDLVKAVLERALEAELTAHLGYDKHHADDYGTGNSRNGKIAKTVQTGVGPVRLQGFIPFLAFTPAVRKLLYTTNSIESLHYQLHKVPKARGHFPTDDAVVKLLWPAVVVSDLHHEGVQEHHRVDGVEGAALPGFDLLHHLLGSR